MSAERVGHIGIGHHEHRGELKSAQSAERVAHMLGDDHPPRCGPRRQARRPRPPARPRHYLNGYVANLQVSGQVVSFLTRHLSYPIASPALFEKIGTRFRDDVRRFTADHGVPMVRFKKGDRKIDVMRPLLAKAAATVCSQVVAVGVRRSSSGVHRRPM
jgi:hypothetical protein